MITGFGRTGKVWGIEHSGIHPDILTIGKALGGGYPVTGLITTEALSRAEPWSKASFSSSSYGGNPLAAAAADAAVAAIIDEKLPEKAALVGSFLFQGLRKLAEKYPFVDGVRGRGLMLGFDLVRDKKTRQPLSKGACEIIFHAALRRGLISMSYTSRVRINPPLVITMAQASEAIGLLDEAFAEAQSLDAWRD
jgi:4-aminobutyrate aminotransferase/(S)-3-amino-2-methylpropionate transaminase